jgi:hypothetical protein
MPLACALSPIRSGEFTVTETVEVVGDGVVVDPPESSPQPLAATAVHTTAKIAALISASSWKSAVDETRVLALAFAAPTTKCERWPETGSRQRRSRGGLREETLKKP